MSKTLLLVEDEALIALAEAQALEAEGYRVLCAHSGEKALEIFRAAEPPVDLVLMDINLGRGMDGGETAQALQSLRDVPVLFLSAYGDAPTLERTRSITPFGFVPKNAGGAVLAAAIDTALRLAEALRRQKEAERFHRAVLDQAWEGIVVYDRGLRHVVWNGFMEELTGVPGDRILGKTVSEAFGAEAGGRLEDHLRRALAGETVVLNEDLYPLPGDGRRRWVAATHAPLRDPDGMVGGVVSTLSDLTGHKNVEDALREAELQYRTLFEEGSDAVTILDMEGLFREVNPTFCQRLGYSREELIGRRVQDIEDAVSASLVPRRMEEIRAKGSLLFEALHIDRNGRTIPTEINARLITFNGTPAVLSFGRDISRRKEAEQALRELRQTSRALLDATEDLMMLVDRDGTVLEANLAMARGFEMPRDDLLGKNLFDLVPPEIVARQRQHFQACLHQEEHAQFEETFDRTLLDIRLFPVGDASGHITRLAISARDITETRKREEALRESEERYRSLFQNNHAIMLLIDPDTGAIVDANPAACAYYGYPLETFTTLDISQINTLPPDEIQEMMLQARTEKRHQFFFFHRRATGEIRPVETYSGPITLHGRKLLYSIVHDITERQQAEEGLRQSLQEKETLQRELRHRVKNSLAMVHSLISLKSGSFDDPSVRQAFQDLARRVEALATLYDTLHRSDAGAEVDLGNYLSTLAERLLASLGQQDRVFLRFAAAPLRLDLKRASACGLILNELVTNALKYAFPKHPGILAVALGTEHQDAGPWALLRVRDDGVGMPENIPDHASSGLAIVRTLVAQLDGTFTCRSDAGTEITIRFPL